MRVGNKIDWWIGLILHLSVLSIIPLVFVVPEDEQFVLIIVFIFMALIIYPFFYGYCELKEDYLEVRLGFIRSRIKYVDIVEIRKCTNFLSSLAMTSKRIEIKTSNKKPPFNMTMIGPKNRDEFFYHLSLKCPNLNKEKSE